MKSIVVLFTASEYKVFQRNYFNACNEIINFCPLKTGLFNTKAPPSPIHIHHYILVNDISSYNVDY